MDVVGDRLRLLIGRIEGAQRLAQLVSDVSKDGCRVH